MSEAAATVPRGLRGTLFAQILGLSLFSLVLSQAVAMAIVLFVPPPSPELFRMAEVAAALKSPGAPVRVRGGRKISASLQDTLRIDDSVPGGRILAILKHDLSSQLSVAPKDVRLTLLGDRKLAAYRNYRLMRSQFGPQERRRPDDPAPRGRSAPLIGRRTRTTSWSRPSRRR